MRVIAGRFKGRKLAHFKADHIRPTTDRIKESVFNKLQGLVEDAKVLDLFSGTGNLTCESLSRGAEKVVAVELSRKSIAIIRENLDLLDVADAVEIVNDDVLKFLKRYQGEPFDLILADPPFTEKLADAVLTELSGSSAVGGNTTIVIESSSHEKVADVYEGLERTDSRDYGDKRVSFWQKSASAQSDAPPSTDG